MENIETDCDLNILRDNLQNKVAAIPFSLTRCINWYTVVHLTQYIFGGVVGSFQSGDFNVRWIFRIAN